MARIDAPSFLRELNRITGPIGAAFTEPLEIVGDVNIMGERQALHIVNIDFLGDVHVHDFAVDRIFLGNCTFRGKLNIYDIRLRNNPVSGTQGVMIQSCSFHDSLTIANVSGGGISINQVEQSPLIVLQELKIPEYSVLVQDVRTNTLQLNGCSFDQIGIVQVNLNHWFLLELINARDIWVGQCVFKGENELENVSVSSRLLIENSHFEKELKLQWDNRIDNTLQLMRSVFPKGCRVEFLAHEPPAEIADKEIEDQIAFYESIQPRGSISIKEGSYGPGLYIMGNNMGYRTSTLLRSLDIEATEELTGKVFVYDTRILNFIIAGFGFRSDLLFFNHVEFKKCSIWQFSNSGATQFIKCNIRPFADQKTPELSILESKPGNLLFQSFDLSQSRKVSIENNDLSGFQYVNISWFNFRILAHNIDVPNDKSRKTLGFRLRMLFSNDDPHSGRAERARLGREAFRQLKQAAEKQGDRIRGLRFQEYEMNLFYEELRLTKTIFSQDRFIIWLSRSNNFGRSWLKPVLILLGITAAFWIAIVALAIKDVSFGTILVEYNVVFVQMLNPVHATDKLFSEEVVKQMPTAVWWLDYLHRLILAYLVLQTISAFRKYVKS